MPIRVALHHHTSYTYDRPVTLLPQVVRLRPAPHCRTNVSAYSLKIEPAEHFLNWQQDPYGNYLARLVFPKLVRKFSVTVDLIAEMTAINPFDFFLEASAEEFPFTYSDDLKRELTPYLACEPVGPELAKLLVDIHPGKGQTNTRLVEINRSIRDRVNYVIRLEPGVQACEETLTKKSGSCRDSAWLLVQVLRNFGIAARFVSGYLIQLVSDVKSIDGPSGPTADFTDLHAWAEAYLPGAGWVGLDATSGLLCAEGHLPLACSADPSSAAPITGAFDFLHRPGVKDDKVETEFDYKMSITRIHEDPRVTKPYTDEEWASIDRLGHQIDDELREGDVRLTMGGEPTFVSVDDYEADEWNTTALGVEKRRKASVLLHRMREQWTSGAVVHHGQGKWYPGESLPRWALSCHWRKDGQPIWEDATLFADERIDYGHSASESERFLRTLAENLGVNPDHTVPGYEDAWYYMWRERRLPTNVDPLKSKLEDQEERKRLATIFERGLKNVVGHMMPLRRVFGTNGPAWQSGTWSLRREHLFLLPGDSPMGYRLPLDSIPWSPETDRDEVYEPDPSIREPAFPDKIPLHRDARGDQRALPESPYALDEFPRGDAVGEYGPNFGERFGNRPIDPFRPNFGLPVSPTDTIRTSLCVEPRNGRLHVFLPPQRSTEDFLDLIAAIEATASTLKMPIILEGYKPPHDARVQHFSITPDPGVLEVNVHPSATWAELSKRTTTLYDEAHLTRLTTERFMLDGRHVGTGGGNHMILGGLTPQDSPLLRRPDLMRSLIGYWHNHPALSYLFSGMFVGPTSQSPRVDEARNDSIYELELAFQQIKEGGATPPWLADRILRNLLIDVTGNTHRAEFCIDKLYSPDSATGRLGLLEFRAFEMPPHAQMSLAQQLLLRAFVARFWKQPYKAKLVRWGTELHDRFMLPHFVMQDFGDVTDEMRQAGYPISDAWFAPHREFRFPVIGDAQVREMHLELRHAIEPWHVMGEEGSPGGAVRYVDSSVERLQVKLEGMVDSRHILTCNGRRVPLTNTGVNGEYVAGVRFKAWWPPSALHPTIPPHAPLTFDLIDTWAKRSVGGCSYHVSHPGGRAGEKFPVNALEAEGRRLARYYPWGHTAGPMTIPPIERLAEFPLTLDLRQPL